MDSYTIGIDIGGTNFRIGTVSGVGEIMNFERKASGIFSSGDVIEILYDEITSYMKRYSCKEKIKAVAIGIPSMVSKDKKTVYSAPNLKGFDNLYFGDRLEIKIGVPVYIDRDVNFLLQNDIEKLELDKRKTIVGFYVGTGFGNAIYIDGEFYGGKNGAAGELGHIPLLGINEKCTCGNEGCCEVRCSGKYLEKIVEEYYPNTDIKKVFHLHGEDERIVEYVKNLAVPIATEINILDPDYIILAGGVLFMEDFPKEILLDSIKGHTRKPYPEQNLEMFFSEHTQMSGVYGSGKFAHQRINSVQN